MLNGQAGTVLVIDDDRKNLLLAREILDRESYRVLAARDGETGIQCARRSQPDIILLDVIMPGIDGFETFARLKGDEGTRKIPIIFLTSLHGKEERLMGFHEGGADYVTKPLHTEELVKRIATHMRSN